jgi:hypothetical protein
MRWAVEEQHASVVNLSLGGPDGLGMDLVEQAVADLTAQYDVLFVASAGNKGADATIGSPASAPAAIAVGAVDGDDRLADFSSRGPAIGDAGPKPDLTAPGVGIAAARSADGPGAPGESYVTFSGTSMATPHVAGAAALLRQRYPDWPAERVKATLMASAARADGVGVYGQGAGRVDVARALDQRVAAVPPSLAFGLQRWPHDDDQPVAREISYHNSGTAPVELTLAVDRPDTFTVADQRLTVPAGGTARTTVTATTPPGTPIGAIGGYLTATAGDAVVATPVSVGVEEEKYDLTLVHTGRDGAPAAEAYPWVIRTDGESMDHPVPADGKLRLPRGRYMISTSIYGPDGDLTTLVWPALELTGDRTVELDARLGKPLAVTVPDASAAPFLSEVVTLIPTDDGQHITLLGWAETFDRWYTAQLGPDIPVDGVVSRVGSQWATPSGTAYRLAWFETGRVPTGFRRDVRPDELATVRVSYARQTPGAGAQYSAFAWHPDHLVGGFVGDVRFALPATRTERYNTQPGVVWQNNLAELTDREPTNQLWGDSRYRAGRTYQETWNRGVLGPAFSGIRTPDGVPEGIARTGDTIDAYVTLHADTARRFSHSEGPTAISLYREGVLVGEVPSFEGSFAVPPGEAGYRLRYEASRGKPADLATHTTVDWTFRSGTTGGKRYLPVSVVRLTPTVDSENTARAGVTARVPVCVHRQASSGAGPVRSLTVDVSYDDGQRWQAASVVRAGDCGLVTLHHPVGDGYVSLRAVATDKAGNTVTQTQLRAYRLA